MHWLAAALLALVSIALCVTASAAPFSQCMASQLYLVPGSREFAIYTAMRASSNINCANSAATFSCMNYFASVTGIESADFICMYRCPSQGLSAQCGDVPLLMSIDCSSNFLMDCSQNIQNFMNFFNS